MLDANDFAKKQVLMVFARKGDHLQVLNDNIIVKDKNNKTKYQSTCYRLLAVFVIGHTVISTGLIDRSRKFGFCIALFSAGFRPYEVIGSRKDANTVLHKLQYEYHSLEIAQHITNNKILNQRALLNKQRKKCDELKKAIALLDDYAFHVYECTELSDVMGYEGMASKIYFSNHFDNVDWKGRRPRIKSDMVNSLLDIGYTLLFSYIDTLLNIYGFDTYCGVIHTAFYMRKSLTCDIMEPFRPLIDQQVKKSINLKQFKEEDFETINLRWELKYKKNPEYLPILMTPILERRQEIFKYIQSYYRAFMRQKPIREYPKFLF